MQWYILSLVNKKEWCIIQEQVYSYQLSLTKDELILEMTMSVAVLLHSEVTHMDWNTEEGFALRTERGKWISLPLNA